MSTKSPNAPIPHVRLQFAMCEIEMRYLKGMVATFKADLENEPSVQSAHVTVLPMQKMETSESDGRRYPVNVWEVTARVKPSESFEELSGDECFGNVIARVASKFQKCVEGFAPGATINSVERPPLARI